MADALYVEFIVRRNFRKNARGELENSLPGFGGLDGAAVQPIEQMAHHRGLRIALNTEDGQGRNSPRSLQQMASGNIHGAP